MSADLFAEFGSSSDTASKSNQQDKPIWQLEDRSAAAFNFLDDFSAAPVPGTQGPPQSLPVPHPSGANLDQSADDNDDWGDFEGGTSTFEPAAHMKEDPFGASTSTVSQAPPSSWQATTHDDVEPFSFSTAQSAQTTCKKALVIKAKKSSDPSVLFDAEDDFDDDDFGDFEEPESAATNTTAAPSNSIAVRYQTVGNARKAYTHGASTSQVTDLLGTLDLSEPVVSVSKMKGAVGHEASTPTSLKGPGASFGSAAPSQRTKAVTIPTVSKEEDPWDTFDDWEASVSANVPKKATSKSKKKESTITVAPRNIASPPPVMSPTFDDPQPGELPPTNVPPPAVLLSLFPPLFADAQDKLFKPMAAQTLPMRNKVLAEPATVAYLQGYLMLASVAAHIIAGRKLRWKRDQHLSQGMRIGSASSRATSGMKLSTIDRNENMKEEREASDVVRAWKDQVGRLRHVVAAANQIKSGTLGTVPDLQEAMPVKVLKQGEGGVPAAQACMLCGLKRDERVGAVDMGVEDSFGEWWVEQVNMHRGCRNFWGEHKEWLRQR